MSDLAPIYASFPAHVIPILWAWAGDELHGNTAVQGVCIKARPTEGTVLLFATDGYNAILLEEEGHLVFQPTPDPPQDFGGAFAFTLSKKLVDACRPRPSVELIGPGYTTDVELPGWLQPGKVFVIHYPETTILESTAVHVGPVEQAEEGGELLLCIETEVSRNPSLEELFNRAPVDLLDPPPEAGPVSTPIPTRVIERVQAIQQCVTVLEANGSHFWSFNGGRARTGCLMCSKCHRPAVASLPGGGGQCASCQEGGDDA